MSVPIIYTGLVEVARKKEINTDKSIKELGINKTATHSNINKKIGNLEEKLKGAAEELKLLKKMLK